MPEGKLYLCGPYLIVAMHLMRIEITGRFIENLFFSRSPLITIGFFLPSIDMGGTQQMDILATVGRDQSEQTYGLSRWRYRKGPL
jgi:hypothetical protein